MALFPAMRSIRARDLSAQDVVYGRQGTYPGTFLLLKYPVTITGVNDYFAVGANVNATPFKIKIQDDVLIALEA